MFKARPYISSQKWNRCRQCGWTISFLFCIIINTSAQQSGPIQLDIKESISLVDFLSQLEKKYDLTFSYDVAAIKDIQLMSQKIAVPDITSLIDFIAEKNNLDYKRQKHGLVLLRPKSSRQIQKSNKNSQTIIGQIQNTDGGPIPFAAVALDTSYLGVESDENGNFELEISTDLIGRSLIIQSLGYKSSIIPIKDLESNTTITLVADIIEIEQVDVVDEIKSLEIASSNASTKTRTAELQKQVTAPGLTNDVLRSVQMQAGVDASNDASAEIKIRGSQGDETLIVLDGIPIYKADHYFGIFGAVNGNHINTTTLYKNTLPLQYGGKTGGMVDMNSKNYITAPTGVVDANMLTSSMTFVSPISEQWSFIVSGRTTYNNAADSRLFNSLDPAPREEEVISTTLDRIERPTILTTTPEIRFFDLNGKLLFRPHENHSISLNYFQSQDDYENSYNITYRQANGGQSLESYSEIEQSKNLGFSLIYNGKLKNDWSIRSSLHRSDYNYEGSFAAGLTFERLLLDPIFGSMANNRTNIIKDLGGQVVVSKNLAKNQDVKFGISSTRHSVDFTFQNDQQRQFEDQSIGTESALFTSFGWRPSENWYMDLGARINLYSETTKVYPSPRVFTNYKINDHWRLKAAFSVNYQFLRETTFYTSLREPIDIFLLTTDRERSRAYPVGVSTNLMVGASFESGPWYADLEMYDRTLDGVVEQTPFVFGGSDDPDSNELLRQNIETLVGKGKVSGVDLTLGYEQQSISSYLAYTLSTKTNQFDEILRNEPFPAQDDRRHQLKWNNLWSNGKWTISGTYVFASGRSFIDVDNPIVDLINSSAEELYIELPSYQRLDLGLTYDLNLVGMKSSFGLQVFNLTNNRNLNYIQYLFVLPRGGSNEKQITGTSTQLLDRTFNLVFNVKW